MDLSQVHAGELVLCFTLLQLAVIVLAARVGGTLAVRIGQSRAVGEIVTGLLLGPSLLGWLAPGAFGFLFAASPLPAAQAHDVTASLKVLSQLGLVLLMFQIGMAFEFRQLARPRQRRAVLLIAGFSLLLPFALGLVLGVVSQPLLAPGSQALGYALFMATAMSITAVPILGRMLIELKLERSALGVITLTAAAANDVVGWFVLAVITSLSLSQFSGPGTALRVGEFLLYAAFCWFALRPMLKAAIRRFGGGAGLPPSLLALLLALVFASAICTFLIGIFAIFGGFILGVLLHDEPDIVAAWRAKVGDLVAVLLLPVFFTYTGLRTHIGSLDASGWAWCAALIAVATAGKFGGGWLGARLSGMSGRESACVGIMMNTRALMELIVLNVGYDLGVIPPPVFTMLVVMAVFSTIVTMPLLRRWLPGDRVELPQGESLLSV